MNKDIETIEIIWRKGERGEQSLKTDNPNNADANMTQLLSDLALKAPIPTAGEVTADGEFLGWDGSAFTKKSVSVQGGAFDITEVNGEIIFDPNYTVIDAATGVFDFVDNGTEYIIRVKPSLAA